MVLCEMTPTEAPAGDPIIDLIAEVIGRHDPGSLVLPYLMTATSDARHWTKLGMKHYGFSPLKLPQDANFTNLFHGHDERIPIEGFRFGLKTLFELVAKLVT